MSDVGDDMSDTITLDQAIEQYECTIQIDGDKHRLIQKPDTILLENASWEECMDKLIEMWGDVEVSHIIVANAVMLRRGDWDV